MQFKIKKQSLRLYRMIVVVRPTLSAEKALQLVQSMIGKDIKVITQNQSMQNLAYQIDGNKQGHFILTDIESDAIAMWKMRRALEIDENILRVMSVKNDAKALTVGLKDENIKSISQYTTKMGKISIPRMPRSARSKISKTIKRYRFLSVMPFLAVESK